jgi:hypothetical protein
VSEYLAGEIFREAGEGVPVGQPPVDDVLAMARDRRRRRVTWGGAVVAVTVVALGVGTWVGTRPPDDGLPDVTVRSESNPANIEWYANGVLHLRRVTVDIPQVVAMVQVPDGIVYADRAGHVVLVDVEGTLTSIGNSEPGTPIVASPERGWVAWLEPGSLPDLVVHDTVTRHELARRPVNQGTRPIAIDQDRLYFHEHGESWSWQLPDIDPAIVPNADLYDVAAAVRVQRAEPGTMQIRQPLLATRVFVPGSAAVLSPDGEYVLTRLDLASLPGVVRIYDGNGDQLETGVDDDELTLAAAFGPDHTVTYVVTTRDHGTDGDDLLRLSESRPFELRTCALETGTCSTITQFGNDHGLPVLPNN